LSLKNIMTNGIGKAFQSGNEVFLVADGVFQVANEAF